MGEDESPTDGRFANGSMRGVQINGATVSQGGCDIEMRQDDSVCDKNDGCRIDNITPIQDEDGSAQDDDSSVQDEDGSIQDEHGTFHGIEDGSIEGTEVDSRMCTELSTYSSTDDSEGECDGDSTVYQDDILEDNIRSNVYRL